MSLALGNEISMVMSLLSFKKQLKLLALRNNSWFAMSIFPLTRDLQCPREGLFYEPRPPREEDREEIRGNHDGCVSLATNRPELLQATEVLRVFVTVSKLRYR